MPESIARRKVRMALVGGGEGAFIGPVHRMAAELDGHITLVAGAFSNDAQRSIRSGTGLYGLPAERCYPDYQTMFAAQATLPPAERIDFVTIATPNHLHAPIAHAALDAGLHVVCDKPVTHRLADALALRERLVKTDRLFALTYNYSGYPMVREARALIQAGRLGSIRKVVCEYFQGWLAEDVESRGNRQAEWRTDPERSGAAGCFGDIGSHAQHLLEFVSGCVVGSLCADLSTFVPGRRLDDDGTVLLRFDNGAKGVLMASQIAVGEENNLRLRVYGDKGALAWSQMEPNSLTLRWPDHSMQTLRTGGPGGSPAGSAVTRLPAGHPEGYLEAFAALYRNFAQDVLRVERGASPERDYPGVEDGVRSLQFIETAVASSSANGDWLPLHQDVRQADQRDGSRVEWMTEL
ncbi:MAG: Gfo/Idh/MocA family oxidoreductase [Pseudomonadales bacterium]